MRFYQRGRCEKIKNSKLNKLNYARFDFFKVKIASSILIDLKYERDARRG